MPHGRDGQFTFTVPEQQQKQQHQQRVQSQQHEADEEHFATAAWASAPQTPDTASTAAIDYLSGESADESDSHKHTHNDGYGAVLHHQHNHTHNHNHSHSHQHFHFYLGPAQRRRHLHHHATQSPSPAPASAHQSAADLCEPQDPLTWLLAASASAPAPAPSSLSSARVAELLEAHGVGQQGWGSAADADTARRWSQRCHTLASSSGAAADEDDEFGRNDPHWDDMLTFRQTRVRVPRERAWSGAASVSASASEASPERSSSFSSFSAGGGGRWWRLLPMATSAAGRAVCFTALPVCAVVAWCAVPLKTGAAHKLDFWFFLVFYYGLYNAVALALVTQIFHVYSLTWWPRSVGGVAANVISWLFATLLGALVHVLGTGIERIPLAWTALTLLTLLLPVAVSFASIQRHHRRSMRRRRWASAAGAGTTAASDSDAGGLLRHDYNAHSQQHPLIATSVEWRTPASYRRFLWFCSSFLLWYAALAAGEYLAYVYIDTLPHTTKDGFYYVYSWIATINVLSVLANWVVTSKIRSWPLQYIYSMYFFTTYFIFYRNLFARLQNPEQVVLLQLGSSMWVVLVYPLRMARPVYRALAFLLRWSDADYPYETYVRQLGRSFFLRNKAENATMLGFLCWVSVLHFGPNSSHYPYFRFEPKDDEFSYEYALTIRASAYVWASELVASRVVRFIFRRVYALDIGAEAVYDFKRYPHVVPVLVLVTVHVLQNILFGLIRLDFA
ncbi:hypothetical protein LPJ72_001722 [Coemansia sp. Benny D160-2]|nr:hypothetical protein LPJ72_001722 [Coemansia sp. Benny D160-2]